MRIIGMKTPSNYNEAVAFATEAYERNVAQYPDKPAMHIGVSGFVDGWVYVTKGRITHKLKDKRATKAQLMEYLG